MFQSRLSRVRHCINTLSDAKFFKKGNFNYTKTNLSHIKADNSKVVSIEQAKLMPKDHTTMPNDILITLAVSGDYDANEERVIREIMATDNIPWDVAYPKFVNIANSNRKDLFLATLPHKTGIFLAVTAAFGSIPMIFDLNTVMWFNEMFVTSDVPEAKDLETPLEVGSWAWNWMEPPLGQISFFLLCLQYARAQMQNLGYKPYTDWFKHRRALRICKEFPQYNDDILTAFSLQDDLSASFIPVPKTPAVEKPPSAPSVVSSKSKKEV